MHKGFSLALCLMFALPVVSSAVEPDDRILSFETMVGVMAPFTGRNVPPNPVRGVNGGGVPWAIAEAKGELRVDGRLEIEVKGLVVTSSGVNPAAAFRAIVSCLTTATDADGRPLTTNVMTDPFPATPEGDSEIEAIVVLPSPCIAPIVFVTNAAGTSWFASTGF